MRASITPVFGGYEGLVELDTGEVLKTQICPSIDDVLSEQVKLIRGAS